MVIIILFSSSLSLILILGIVYTCHKRFLQSLQGATHDLEDAGTIITDEARAQLCDLANIPCSPHCHCEVVRKRASLIQNSLDYSGTPDSPCSSASPKHSYTAFSSPSLLSTPNLLSSPPGYTYSELPATQIRPAPSYDAPATLSSPHAFYMNPSRMNTSVPFDTGVLESYISRFMRKNKKTALRNVNLRMPPLAAGSTSGNRRC